MTDTLLEELRAAGEAGLTKEQIRDLFGRNAKAARIDAALETLRRFGFATPEKRKNPEGTRGRPATIWKYTTHDENAEESAEPPDDGNDVYDRNQIPSLKSFLSLGGYENGDPVAPSADVGTPTRIADREAALRV